MHFAHRVFSGITGGGSVPEFLRGYPVCIFEQAREVAGRVDPYFSRYIRYRHIGGYQLVLSKTNAKQIAVIRKVQPDCGFEVAAERKVAHIRHRGGFHVQFFRRVAQNMLDYPVKPYVLGGDPSSLGGNDAVLLNSC